MTRSNASSAVGLGVMLSSREITDRVHEYAGHDVRATLFATDMDWNKPAAMTRVPVATVSLRLLRPIRL